MAKKRKKPRKKKIDVATKYVILTTIVIESGNVIDNPEPLVVPPKGAAVWLVDNRDSDPHDVSIDPRNITHKNNHKKEHPFTTNTVLSVSVAAQSFGVMFALTKGGLRDDQYKYEIVSSNGDGTVYKLDPDLDVIDPNSILNT